jgi:enoyl-CoA hydratase/carnithine racemase
MPSSNVVWDIDGLVGTLTFNRPHARNALTWDMYEALAETCDEVERSDLRVLVIRGAGGAFAAGTDISQFTAFASGDDGIAYERRLDAVIDGLERVRKVTVAVVEGPAVGGGCAIALACDLRLCTPAARFGVPVAKTLGNCLSAANLARLVDLFGTARVKDLLLTARLIEGQEALALGFATRLVTADTLESDLRAWTRELSQRASSTVEATKAVLQRIRDHRRPPSMDDVIAKCYASAEFREGVAAFLEGRPPAWARRAE